MKTENGKIVVTQEQLTAGRRVWDLLASRFPKGATAKARLAAEQKEIDDRAKAEKAQPAPDPHETALAVWAASDSETFASLKAVIDRMIQFHAAERREAVGSHAHMAFHDGECAGLEQLRSKLTKLSSG